MAGMGGCYGCAMGTAEGGKRPLNTMNLDALFDELHPITHVVQETVCRGCGARETRSLGLARATPTGWRFLHQPAERANEYPQALLTREAAWCARCHTPNDRLVRALNALLIFHETDLDLVHQICTLVHQHRPDEF